MPRPKNPVPSYRLHKQSRQAIVTVRTPAGKRRDVLLGPYDSPESRAEYARIIAELAAVGPVTVSGGGQETPDLTVNELLVGFLRWALAHYRDPDGAETSEVDEIRRSLGPVRELYGHTPAAAFGPKALAAVRGRMVERGWCRTLVNRRVERVRRAWKWAAAEELVPVTTYQALRTLAGLKRGRAEAREADPVGPVDPAVVDATLPFLSRHVRGLVAFCRLTGCRPGEACRLTRGQVEVSGPVWMYRPARHKGRHRGKVRLIPVGPRAQTVLAAFPTGGPDDPVFSPRLAREERYAALRTRRKSKVPPSQVYRRKASPLRAPRDKYTGSAFAAAVGKATAKAGVPHWHPNQLRHLLATEVRKAYGLEAAQVVLGHAKADVTQVYAERDLALALKVAAERG